jgi:hypothetical protein
MEPIVMKFVLLLLALLLSGWTSPSSAQSCVAISSLPKTITAPGNYCLGVNHTLTMTTGNAINIAANDVVLDCQNFTIRNLATANNGTSNAINITNRNSVTVKNCRIIGGFATGIWAYQNNTLPTQNYYINLLDNYIAGTYWYGILAYGSAIEIRNNRIYDVSGQVNNFAMAIRVAGSPGYPRFHVVTDNVIAGPRSTYNNAYGVYSDNSVGGIFTNNRIHAPMASNPAFRGYGFRIGGYANRITDNHVTGTADTNETGIFAATADTTCFDNYIRMDVVTQGCDASLGNK